MRRIKWLMAMLTLLLALPISAQEKDWEPTGVWPFINKHFRTAKVYAGVFHQTETEVPCNIHVGNHTLWYSQNDTLMEAIKGTVTRIQFPNGDIYIPVGSEQMFGRIVRQDVIDGSVARVIHVRVVNQKELDQKYLDHINKTQNALQGMTLSHLADTEAGVIMEQQPLPMNNLYYFQVRGEIFPATPKNILSHINPQRKQEYRNFTRSAEIISSNESSMLKVWQEFFLKR
ncbi:MAG: hypothetical protein IJ693_04340 [Bacteroidaceae bacterium]|nr:hypothetical protein [Bacteroidaceae bacterium]